jgi:hypothetical protein
MSRMVGLALVMLLGLLSVPATAADEVEPACVQPPPRGQAAPLTVVRAAAPGMVETRIHWTHWSTRLVYGLDAVLAGQVVTEDGALAEVTVDLYARSAGQTEWSHLTTRSSDPETGVFTFTCLDVPRSTDYRVVYDGTVLFAGSSATKRVSVARLVESTMRHRADGRFVFAGSVAPRYAERRVVLQRKGCDSCGWERVQATATDTRSAWRFVVTAPKRGARYFRAVVPQDAAFVTGRSRVWRVSR